VKVNASRIYSQNFIDESSHIVNGDVTGTLARKNAAKIGNTFFLQNINVECIALMVSILEVGTEKFSEFSSNKCEFHR